MIAIYIGLLLTWTFCCVTAGRIYEARRIERDDLNARDEWANDMEKGAA